ncbi:hypothetical protein OAZ20_00315, partial [Paracoccaceae bacterium]|nr:hypothetical protein [Paracoccaceae bacterium]
MLRARLGLFIIICTCIIPIVLIFKAPIKFVGTDDSFYYIVTAFNYLKTGTVSFDGITETNGFHPLYFYILVIGYQFFEITLESSILFGALLNTLFYFLGSFFVYFNFRERISFQTFFIVAIIGYLTPFILVPIPGLDVASWIESTEFALSFCTFAIYMVIINKILSIERVSTRTHLLTYASIFIIIQFFVRTDSPLLTVPILFAALIFKREYFRYIISTWSLVLIVPFGILVYFYLSSNYYLNGSLVQISGIAKSYHMTLGAEGSFFSFNKRLFYYVARIFFGTEENAIAIYKLSLNKQMFFGVLNFAWVCTLLTALVFSFRRANKPERKLIILISFGTF